MPEAPEQTGARDGAADHRWFAAGGAHGDLVWVQQAGGRGLARQSGRAGVEQRGADAVGDRVPVLVFDRAWVVFLLVDQRPGDRFVAEDGGDLDGVGWAVMKGAGVVAFGSPPPARPIR